MPWVWKLEISSTTHHHILMLKYGSIQENPLISILRKSRQLWLVTKLEKVARFRRESGSKESPNGLVPPTRSRLRNPASVPPVPLDFTHTTLFGKWVCQIIPVGIWNTPLIDTNFIPTNFIHLLQDPRFHTLGVPGSKPPAFSQCFVRAEEDALAVSFNSQSQSPDIPVFRLAWHFRVIQTLYRTNPRSRTSNCCLYVCLWKSSWFLSTPKIKLRMILPPRIVSVLHVISS